MHVHHLLHLKMAPENSKISANNDPSCGRWPYILSPDNGNVGLDIFALSRPPQILSSLESTMDVLSQLSG